MKKIIFLFIYFSIIASCAVSNRIIQMGDQNKELKSFKLVQNPDAYSLGEKNDQSVRSKIKLASTFLFEERQNGRPRVTVNYGKVPALKSRTELFYKLDGEIIQVDSNNQLTDGRFIIPENLWVSIVHAQKIQCSLHRKKEVIDIELNQSERNKLAEFFQLAIDQLTVKFPAIPEGKKKW